MYYYCMVGMLLHSVFPVLLHGSDHITGEAYCNIHAVVFTRDKEEEKAFVYVIGTCGDGKRKM